MTGKSAVSLTPPSRLEGRKARAAAHAIADKRRHRRINVPVQACVLHENGRQSDCAITSISVGGLSAHANLTPRINSQVVVIVEKIGRVHGRVVRVSGSTFAIAFETFSDRKRIKLADELAWVLNSDNLGLNEDRHGIRQKKSGFARIGLGGGLHFRRNYIDVSENGASFETTDRPAIGERADVDSRPARVVRIHSRGFAVEFDTEADAASENSAEKNNTDESDTP